MASEAMTKSVGCEARGLILVHEECLKQRFPFRITRHGLRITEVRPAVIKNRGCADGGLLDTFGRGRRRGPRWLSLGDRLRPRRGASPRVRRQPGRPADGRREDSRKPRGHGESGPRRRRGRHLLARDRCRRPARRGRRRRLRSGICVRAGGRKARRLGGHRRPDPGRRDRWKFELRHSGFSLHRARAAPRAISHRPSREPAPSRAAGRTRSGTVDRSCDPPLASRCNGGARPGADRRQGEIEGFIINRLQGALLREAWALFEEGYASAADIDLTVSRGLGLRWSFMGPFETIDLNAPGGVDDYARRLGPLYHSIVESRANQRPWSPELIERVRAERRAALAKDKLPERSAWRGRRLMALVAHRRSQPSE